MAGIASIPWLSTSPKAADSVRVAAVSLMPHPSAGITQFRFMRSARDAPSQPGSRAPAKADLTALSNTPRSGEEVGEDSIHLWVQGQAHMAAVDLNGVDVRP